MYAHAGSIRFDVLMPVIRDVERQERWLPNLSAAEWAVDVFQSVFSSCVSIAATAVIWGTRRLATKLERNALLIEGAKIKLMKALVERSIPGPLELLEPLRRLQSSSRQSVADGEKLMAHLLALNPQSRVAIEVERVNGLFVSIAENTTTMLELLEQGLAHAEILAELRRLNIKLDQQISNYGDEEEFDPELIALAEQAIERINETSRSSVRG